MAGLWTDIAEWFDGRLGIPPKLLARVVFTLVAWALYTVLRLLASSFLLPRISDIPKKYIVSKTINYTVGFGVIIATFVIWFGNVSGWAAYLGIVSAGLAIALQDPVTNFAGWVFITIRKPFAVGDRIQVGEHRGDVIDMRLFQFSMVEIGNWVSADQSTGRIIHIPNGWVFKFTTANYTQGFNFIWNEIAVTVTFESDWKRAKAILSDIAQKHSLLETRAAQEQIRTAAQKYMIFYQRLTPIVWTSVVDNGVVLTIRYICEPRKRRSSETGIWEEILATFAKADDVDFAYPTTRFYDNPVEGKPGARAPVGEAKPRESDG